MSLHDLRRRIRERRKETADQRAADTTSTDALTGQLGPSVAPALSTDAEEALAEAERTVPAFAKRLLALDPWQLNAVLSSPKAAVVEAQVGSGKTTVLVHKVVFLHLIRQVPLARMAVLTFTNKAAAEFRDRVSALLREVQRPLTIPDDHEPEPMRWFGTFHALARTLLAHDLPVTTLGFRADFQVMDANERMALWQRLITTHKLNIKHKRRLSRRMELLQQGQTRFGNMRKDDDLITLAELTAAAKVERGVMDFDDLLANAQALLASHGVAQPPAWLIVDELQDCDFDQLDLIDKLAGPETRGFYVGDPNQVIYSWRGSAPRLFDHLREQHDAETFALPMNYRSTATIVHAARAFLQGSGRLDAASWRTSTLVPVRNPGEPIDIVTCHDPRAEAAWLVAQVRDLLEQGVSGDDIAVLARTRRRLSPIRGALLAGGIRVQERVGWSADELRTLDWLQLLLRAGTGGGDMDSVAAALTHADHGLVRERDVVLPERGTSAGGGESATGDHGLEALQRALEQPARGRRRKGVDRPLAAAVVARLIALESLLDESPTPEAVLDHLLIAPQLGPTRPQHKENLALARAWLTGLLAPCSRSQVPTRTVDVIRRLSEASVDATAAHRRTRAALDAARAPTTTPGETHAAIQVLTMHAAKGLEWGTVFLVGLNAGAIPLPAALRDPDQLSEERRLFFVALTRARNRLALSWCRSPDDPREQELESAFVRLIPAELSRRHDHPATLFSSDHGATASKAEVVGSPSPVQTTAIPDAAAPEDPTWQVGQMARHKRYGLGEVVEVTADALHCDFGARGKKRFTLAMCPLKRVAPSV